MNLVEAEATGPIEGDNPLVTPPRLPHRRVSVSLLFTLTVLIGTVVAIYLRFPTRNSVLMSEALVQHREHDQVWDLARPTKSELRAWAIGILGKDPPLPTDTVIGVRDLEVLDHRAAVMRFIMEGETITYLVQYTRVIAPDHSERIDGDLVQHAVLDEPQRPSDQCRSAEPGRCAGRRFGPAAQAGPEAGLGSRDGRRVIADVRGLRAGDGADRPAIDARRGHRDEELPVEAGIAAHPRAVEGRAVEAEDL